MSVKIGWFVNADPAWNELVYQKPEPLDLNQGHSAQYVKCPATAHYCKNTFVVRSGYDLRLRYDKPTKMIKYIDGSLEPSYVKEMLVQFHPNEWRNPETPIFQLHLDNGFVADESVWMEVFPAFYQAPSLPGHIIPGTFDIYSWQRMVSYSFEWMDIDKEYVINRGDPIFYVRFRSKDPADSFKLETIKMDNDLKRAVEKCQGVKFALKNYSWRLMSLNRLLRPRRYIK
jgi:hypothetical protein